MNNSAFSFRPLALNQGSLGLTEEYIRLRAFELYEQRGRQDGHDVEDWLQAEAEIFGKKSSAPAETQESESAVKGASAAA